MARKIPEDAFEQYFAMGPERSYTALAQRFGVTKRAVTDLAKRERWQHRLRELEAKARRAADQRVAETLETMKTRHLKVYQAIQRKALEALRNAPLDTAIQAVRALTLALEGERRLRGGADGQGGGDDVEAIIKREYQRWMTTESEGEE